MTKGNEVNNRQIFKISQKALVYDAQQQRYLIVKVAETKKATSCKHYELWKKKYGPWDLPGGRVDEGEKGMFESFAREMKEETGITVTDMGEICHTEIMSHKLSDCPVLNIIYLVQYNGDEIVLSYEHSEYEWMSAEEVKDRKEIKNWIVNSVKKSEELLELRESLNSWKRCLADFDNYKKRQNENQKEFTKYAAEGVISDMLPVLDNFHAATDHIPENEKDNPWVTGIMYIQQQMEKVFEDSDVTKMEINVGDEFDPEIMEAIKGDNDVGTHGDASVQKIVQPGYKIGEKVLRPARVTLK